MINMIIAVVIFIPLFLWIRYRSKIAHVLILNWMNENRFEITNIEYKLIFKGPYMFVNGPMMVYWVEAINNDEKQYRGWLKIGHWFLGLLGSKEVIVTWNEDRN